MSQRREEREAEREIHWQIVAFYNATRRPWLEWSTFALALLAAVLVSLRCFGIGITDYQNEGQWLTAFYWVSLILFLGLNSLFLKARHPVPIPFGGFHPSRFF